MTTRKRRTVGLIFEDVEVLDFCGPFEVFAVVRPVGVHDDEVRLFDAVTVAETAAIVPARHGLEVKPACTGQTWPRGRRGVWSTAGNPDVRPHAPAHN